MANETRTERRTGREIFIRVWKRISGYLRKGGNKLTTKDTKQHQGKSKRCPLVFPPGSRLFSLRQNHWNGVVVGPDLDADGLALVESVESHGESDEDGPGDASAGRDFRFGGQSRLCTIFERGERLKVAIKINRGASVGLGVAAGGLHHPMQALNIHRFVAGVVEGEGEGDHGRGLSGDLDGDDVVERS